MATTRDMVYPSLVCLAIVALVTVHAVEARKTAGSNIAGRKLWDYPVTSHSSSLSTAAANQDGSTSSVQTNSDAANGGSAEAHGSAEATYSSPGYTDYVIADGSSNAQTVAAGDLADALAKAVSNSQPGSTITISTTSAQSSEGGSADATGSTSADLTSSNDYYDYHDTPPADLNDAPPDGELPSVHAGPPTDYADYN